jgi:hypothetical protein
MENNPYKVNKKKEENRQKNENCQTGAEEGHQ